MITEKQIDKTKFFTTNGTDIWKVNKIDQITAVELVNCETRQTGTCVIGEDEAKKFHPVCMPKIRAEGSKIKATGEKTGDRSRKPKKKTKNRKEDKKPSSLKTTGTGIKRGRKPSSQYFGVTAKKNRSGKKRFYTQVVRGGKYKSLGGYAIEELAAAAVQEYLGNSEEAKRLRKLAEAKTDEKIKEVKGVTAFDCINCGQGYPYKPDVCGKCGHGHGSFSPAKPEKVR